MAARKFSYDESTMLAVRQRILTFIPGMGLTLHDMDNLLCCYEIRKQENLGKKRDEIAETLNISSTAVFHRRKFGAFKFVSIIIPLTIRHKSKMGEVAKDLAVMFDKPESECNRFLKDFIRDYQYITGHGVSFSELAKEYNKQD